MGFEQDFWVSVQIVTPCGDFGQHFGKAVLNGHEGSPVDDATGNVSFGEHIHKTADENLALSELIDTDKLVGLVGLGDVAGATDHG
jgi:hypothetical protein